MLFLLQKGWCFLASLLLVSSNIPFGVHVSVWIFSGSTIPFLAFSILPFPATRRWRWKKCSTLANGRASVVMQSMWCRTEPFECSSNGKVKVKRLQRLPVELIPCSTCPSKSVVFQLKSKSSALCPVKCRRKNGWNLWKTLFIFKIFW